MKTQIIHLDKNDDFISVRDKISWSQTERVLLVFPAHAKYLNRQLELNLLKRQAEMQGAQLAIIASDAEVHFNARRAGIPVFTSLNRARDNRWRFGRARELRNSRRSLGSQILINKSRPSPALAVLDHPAIRIISFIVSLLALLALAVLILPSAKVTITPKAHVQSMRFDLTADPALTQIDPSTNSLPTSRMEVSEEGSDTIPTTGATFIPDKIAKGALQFTNITNHTITIPQGTIVSTQGPDPIRFITTEADTTVYSGKSAILFAQAVRAGLSGNLPPRSLVAINGDLGLIATVTNLYATYGGTDVKVPSPSEQDLSALKSHLSDTLKKAALSEFQSSLPENATIITPTLQVEDILVELPTPAVGDPGERLVLSLRLKFIIQVVSADAILRLILPALDGGSPSGLSYVPNSLTITRLTSPTMGDDGRAFWSIQAQRKLQPALPIFSAISAVRGAPIDQAITRIDASLPLAENARISLSPSWWPRLPFTTLRIQVISAEAQ